eukprot:tig00000194_g14808.t1
MDSDAMSVDEPAGDSTEVHERYMNWRENIPFLYDWVCNYTSYWPSMSLVWGEPLDTKPYSHSQRVFLTERTGACQNEYPNLLIVARAEIARARATEAGKLKGLAARKSCPEIKPTKKIVHPGEINRVRNCPRAKHVVATHTDAKDVFVWNTDAQPNRQALGRHLGEDRVPTRGYLPPSVPDILLKGHEDLAEYALDWSPAGYSVASGGKDALVCLWDLEDHQTALSSGPEGRDSSSFDVTKKSTAINCREKLRGHEATVEDCKFKPPGPDPGDGSRASGSDTELCSVGDDRKLIFWDLRASSRAAVSVKGAHEEDIHTVDWSPHLEHYVLTGGGDGMVHLFDRRSLTTSQGSAKRMYTVRGQGPVMQVAWMPQVAGVFACGGEDGVLYVYDTRPSEDAAPSATAPVAPRLFFAHCGHRAQIVDFGWNPAPSEAWMMASLSDDSSLKDGGGTLQLWRLLDLVTRPGEEAAREMAGVFRRSGELLGLAGGSGGPGSAA